MRVSTHLIFQRGVESMQARQSSLLDTQQRLATGRRMLSPADDPVAASRAVETAQARALNAGHIQSQGYARDRLALVDSALGAVTDLLGQVRALVLLGGNGALNGADRASLATELETRRAELLALANSRDGANEFLFAGHAEAVQPFADGPGGAVVYAGDQGHRELAIAPGRALQVTENGAEIFMRVRRGNGVFAIAPGPANAGTGVASAGAVTDYAALTNADYRLVFTVAGGVTTYDVIDTTTWTSVSSGNVYTSGQSIAFAGMRFEITGAPANGDTFAVTRSGTQSVFDTIDAAIAALRSPIATDADRARLAQDVAHALVDLDRALDRVLEVRTAAGARLREVEAAGVAASHLAIHQAGRLSELQDLDFVQAASDFAREQQALEAARVAFQRMTSVSLFDYLG